MFANVLVTCNCFSVFKGLINLLLLSISLVYILTNSHVQLWNILSVEEHEQVSVYKY